MTTTHARHRSSPTDLFWWSGAWPVGGRALVHAALTARNLPGFKADPESPFGSGNLSGSVGDDPAEVERRRAAITTEAGCSRLLIPRQVHGKDVAVVDASTTEPPTADALVSATPNLMLGVLVADCVPVMLVDQTRGVVGVAHAGRRGMAAGVVTATLDAMADLGADNVSAVVGPSICARCYEVPDDLRAQVAAAVPFTASVSRTGTASLDIVAGVLAQLRRRTVHIQLLAGCTAETPELFSHRASAGSAGRFAGYAWQHQPDADDTP